MQKQKPTVKLIGRDGNAFFILGTVKEALLKAGLEQEAKEFMKKATADDYNNLLRVVMEYAIKYLFTGSSHVCGVERVKRCLLFKALTNSSMEK
jgi:CO dehydrogenase/acetyl-CoA synthase gamma subunit (corrinoid Fe-S protein)